jgi:hypothetical protein
MTYLNETILIASQHQKEKAIAPAFIKHLQSKILVSDLDTDKLGTFTGEIPRLYDAMTTCKTKALQAAKAANLSYAIASEGSFGPHPYIPFIPYSHEIMVFVDTQANLCIYEEMITEDTNYQTKFVDKNTDVSAFCKQVGFPSHGICVQTSNLNQVIAKGLKTKQELLLALEQGFERDNQLLLSTDMRAMMNPTRMGVIAKLAEKLVLRILCPCPQCHTPGFGQKSVTGFLSCQQCQMPTEIHAFELWGCIRCDYQEKKARSDGKEHINPQYCQFCNP